ADRLLLRGAERAPVGALRHDALERGELDVRNTRLGGADGRRAFLEFLRGSQHHAAELRYREIARAGTVPAAVGDRPHRLPHRHVLGRNALDAGPVAARHRTAVLQVAVFQVSFFPVVLIEVDAAGLLAAA